METCEGSVMKLLTLLSCLAGVQEIIADNIDWCKLSCGNEQNTMCKYKPETNKGECTKMEETTNPEMRKEWLHLHNEYRNNIADGKISSKGGGLWPKASNMREMSWDNDLEQLALRWAQQCSDDPSHDKCRRTPAFERTGQNNEWYAHTGHTFLPTETGITGWINQIEKTTPGIVDNLGEREIGVLQFTQVIWAESFKLGCAEIHTLKKIDTTEKEVNGRSTTNNAKQEFNTTILVCNYGPSGNIFGQQIYRRGDPCTSCPPNTSCRPGSTYPKLCSAEEETPTKPNNISDASAGVQEIIADKIDWCKLSCGNEQNTMCKYKPETNKGECTKIEEATNTSTRKEWLHLHNEYRNKIADGKISSNGVLWPKASNMREMSWDNDLEQLALRWAQQCSEDPPHDTCRRTPAFENSGQNKVWSSSTGQFPPADGFSRWINGIEKAKPEILDSLGDWMIWKVGNRKDVLEFTQVIWAGSYKLGCAAVNTLKKSNGQEQKTTIAVCNYGPRGNMFHQQIYQRGDPCTSCPPNTICRPGSTYPNLCAAEEEGPRKPNDVSDASAGVQEIMADKIDWCKLSCGNEINTMCKYKPETNKGECTKIEVATNTSTRKEWLHLHNEYRNNIADGKISSNGVLWPKASNMREMSWDYDLEKLALRWAQQCSDNPPHDTCRRTPAFEYNGQNKGSFSSTGDMFPPAESFTGWIKEIEKTTPGIVDNLGKSGDVLHFTQVIWAGSYKLGCAAIHTLKTSGGQEWKTTILVCNYGPGGNMFGQQIYQRGDPCTSCPTNTSCIPGSTYPKLCAAEGNPRKPDEVSEASAGVQEIIADKIDWCKLSCDNEQNTMCKYKPETNKGECTKIEVATNPSTRKEWLHLHNAYRNNIADGKISSNGVLWPKASNMREMSWDNDLEKLALRWAQQCSDDPPHDTCRRTPAFEYNGQNKGWSSSTGDKFPPADSFTGWIKEKEQTTPGIVDNFGKGGGGALHFTQVIWAGSYKLGCAAIHTLKKSGGQEWKTTILVCNYGPGGNMFGHQIYRRGDPCTSCPTNTSCIPGSTYPKLCAAGGDPRKPGDIAAEGDPRKPGDIAAEGDPEKPEDISDSSCNRILFGMRPEDSKILMSLLSAILISLTINIFK